jgi:ABC-2 type transport system ATP-binding protein
MIKVENLSKSFKVYESSTGLKGAVKNLFHRKHYEKQVLHNINIEVEEGKIVGLLGPNGAGKTTILKILTGLLRPTEGTVSVNGYNPFNRSRDYLKEMTLVMGQKNQLWWDLSAHESFLLQKSIYEISDDKFKKNLSRLTELFNVNDLINIQVRKLSLGERMKMELINALLYEPKIVFLDEPTIGLDFEAQKNIRSFIKRYNQEYKATIILTSHYLNDIESVCNDIIVINKGKKIINESFDDLFAKFAHQKLIQLVLKEAPENIHILDDLKVNVTIDNLLLEFIVESENVDSIIGFCNKHFLIDKINIENLSFEHIIEQLYSGEID